MPGQVEASTQTEIKCRELRSKFLCLKRLFGSTAKIPRTRRWYGKINEKVWVNVKGHERRVLKCQNKSPPNKLKVKLPGATPEPSRIPHKKHP